MAEVRQNRTQEIAELLGIDEEAAQMVRDYIDENDLLDWSEATEREIASECAYALSEIN